MPETTTQQHFLESATIYRTLRPIRSKLQAFSRDMQLPSNSLCVGGDHSNSRRRVLKRYNSSSNSTTTSAMTSASTSNSRAAGVFHDHAEMAAKYPSLPSPIRRHTIYFKSAVTDAFRKFSSHSTPGEIVPSLARLSSFVLGRHIEGLDEVEDQMELYTQLPSHFRANVMLQHLTSLFQLHVFVPQTLFEIVNITTQVVGAEYQTLDLIRITCLLPGVDLEMFLRFYGICCDIRKRGEYLKVLPQVHSSSVGELLKLCRLLSDRDPDFACHLAFCVLTKLMESEASIPDGALHGWTAAFVSLVSDNEDLYEVFPLLSKFCFGYVACGPADVVNEKRECLAMLKLALVYSTNVNVGIDFQPYYTPFALSCFSSASNIVRLVGALIKIELLDIASFLLKLLVNDFDRYNQVVDDDDGQILEYCQDLLRQVSQKHVYDSDFDEWFVRTSPAGTNAWVEKVKLPQESPISGSGGLLDETLDETDCDGDDLFGPPPKPVFSRVHDPSLRIQMMKRKHEVKNRLDRDSAVFKRFKSIMSSPHSGPGNFY